jgi:hypothetical protein
MTRDFYYLTYAGAIPFILCTVCFSANIKSVYLLGSVEKILSTYGLVILSFLSGSHWGQHLQINRRMWVYALPILSNIIVVFLCFSFLVLSFKTQITMFVVAFIVLLIIDHRLFQMSLISDHYFQTRCFVSVIVIISLIISGAIS